MRKYASNLRLRGCGLRIGVSHFLRELHKEIFVEERIHVGREDIEYPPVTEVDLVADTVANLDRQQSRR